MINGCFVPRSDANKMSVYCWAIQIFAAGKLELAEGEPRDNHVMGEKWIFSEAKRIDRNKKAFKMLRYCSRSLSPS